LASKGMAALLVVACSRRKLRGKGPMPAMERYDGVNYRVLRKAASEGRWPRHVDVLIVSAKHGLLEPNSLIEDYDQLMTAEQARELWPEVCPVLAERVNRGGYREVFLNLGKSYRLAIDGWENRLDHQPRVIYAQGGIGQKASAMLRWLQEKTREIDVG